MDKEVLMIRLGKEFSEQNITNVKVVDFRIIPNGRKKEYETDYSFEYNGIHYRSNEHICKNGSGKLVKPVCFNHELICLDEV